jgi:hypothetical protein
VYRTHSHALLASCSVLMAIVREQRQVPHPSASETTESLGVGFGCAERALREGNRRWFHTDQLHSLCQNVELDEPLKFRLPMSGALS